MLIFCKKNKAEEKIFGFFKSSSLNQLLCIKCFQVKQKKDQEAIELNEKKQNEERKLEVYPVSHHSLRLRNRITNK